MDRAWDLEVVGEAKLPIDLGVGIAVAVEVVLEVVPSPLPSPTPQRKPCQSAPLDSSSSSNCANTEYRPHRIETLHVKQATLLT